MRGHPRIVGVYFESNDKPYSTSHTHNPFAEHTSKAVIVIIIAISIDHH
jgi:hypothetical protein